MHGVQLKQRVVYKFACWSVWW